MSKVLACPGCGVMVVARFPMVQHKPGCSEAAHTVKLDYFKRTGKWYTSGTYVTHKQWMFEIFDEVRKMRDEGRLPGLQSGGHGEFIVLVTGLEDFPNNYPGLIV